MTAIYKREMRSYLTSPVGYVFLAVFFAISGYYFFATSLVSNTTDMSYVFSNLFSIVIFLVPMLTMRLFSEERKQKTEQALFTAPVGFPIHRDGKISGIFKHVYTGNGNHAGLFSGNVPFSGSGPCSFLWKLFRIVFTGCSFVCLRYLYFIADRKSGNRRSRISCNWNAAAVYQQLYTGYFQYLSNGDHGWSFVLSALS